MFLVEGWASVESQRFAINLQTGPNVNPRDDVAFHLGFNFSGHSCSLTTNTIEHNTWGNPVEHPNCHVRRMEPFQILILVQRRAFMVAINNQHFCEFSHRLDPTRIRYITADGQVTVTKLQLEFPGGLGEPVSSPSYHPAQSTADINPNQTSGWPAPPANLYGTASGTSHSSHTPAQPSHNASSTSTPAAPKSLGLMGMLPTGAAAVGALGTLATLAAPLLYPGKKNKMYKKGNKQRGLLAGLGLPSMGGAMGGNHCGHQQYGHTGHKAGGGLLGPGLAGGLGAAALGMGLSRMMGGMGGGRHHHGGYGGHGRGGWSRRSSSSSSSSSD
ncbi:hypothetical protein RvY_11595-2 [Ramazzottius varieornatus]|nr:hypothetical protein RvY_11595-2 [Ramazzottius varieornatus]